MILSEERCKTSYEIGHDCSRFGSVSEGRCKTCEIDRITIVLAYYGNVSEGKCKTSCYDCEITESLTGLGWKCVPEGRCKDIILQLVVSLSQRCISRWDKVKKDK